MADGGFLREDADRNAATIEAMFESHRKMFEFGDTSHLIQAIRLAIMWNLPVPGWAKGHADAAVIHYFKCNGGAEKRGKRGGIKTRYERGRLHRKRHKLVERELARNLSLAEACRRVSLALRGKEGAGEPRQIKASHRKVSEALKTFNDGAISGSTKPD